jgi:integrase
MEPKKMNGIGSFSEVEKWLNGKKASTTQNYLSALRIYLEYTQLNPTQLIDEAEADQEKKVRERGVPEQRIKGFAEWLLTKYQQRGTGPLIANRKHKGKIGLSEKLTSMYCGAVKSFYRDNGFRLNIKLARPSVKKENFKLVIRAAEMSKLLSAATSLRDRAIIKFMYESCQGVSEVCGLNYGDIQKFTEASVEVWQFHVIRKKTRTEYFTEIGAEAIELLNLYFEERKRNGEELTIDSPLFVKEGAKKFTAQRMKPNLIENTFKHLAIKSGIVSEEKMKNADLNPARPHALRAAGMSILKLDGYNSEAVEFRCGHELGSTQQAYWLTRPDELRKLFAQHYKALCVQTGTSQVIEEEVKKLRRMVGDYEVTVGALSENGKIKLEKIQTLEEEQKQTRQELEHLKEFQRETMKRINELAEFQKDMKFYKEGGVVVISHKDLSPAELADAIETSKQQKKKDV